MAVIRAEDLVASLLNAAARGAEGESKARPKDIQARVLTDALKEWMEPCPFERGDLVVIREKGSGMGPGSWNERGHVFIVAARIPPTSPLATGVEGYNIHARLFDMLLLAQDSDGDIAMLRAESRHFTKYTGEIA